METNVSRRGKGVSRGTLGTFDNVTFQNMDPAATQLTINHSGTASTFTFDNVSFLSAPTNGVGFYIRANDTGGGDPLDIRLTNPTPADGSADTQLVGGALVTWG